MRDILTLLLILHFVFKNFSKTKQSHLKNKNTKKRKTRIQGERTAKVKCF